MSPAVIPVLMSGIDHAWDRLRDRLAGIGRDEWLWQPVTDTWSVRRHGEQWLVDVAPGEPDPAPVTTIAWRLWHLGSDCLPGYVREFREWTLPVSGREWFPDPEPALAAAEQGYRTFRERVVALGEEGIWRPLGTRWGQYADDSWAALVVHAQDELSHHGAEIALLRDLYARLGRAPAAG